MKKYLKFRTWFKEHKHMDYDTGVYQGCAVVRDDSCAFNPAIVTQHIGIKDKNKQELYVGDIVTLNTSDATKFIIEYSIKELAFVLKNLNDANEINTMNTYDVKRLLKIGNIYENRDLLIA